MILLDLTRKESLWQLLLAEYERLCDELARAENKPAEDASQRPPLAFGE